MLYWPLKRTVGPLIKVAWITSIEGLENIPVDGPAILAANHCSFLDPPLLVASIPRRIRFLTGEFLYEKPLVKHIIKHTGNIKVDRRCLNQADVYKKASNVLREGEILGVFPEGRVSPDGNLQKAFKGAGKIALENHVEIIPAAIIGTFDVWGLHQKMPKLQRRCILKVMRPITYDEMEDLSPDEVVHHLLMPQIATALEKAYEFQRKISLDGITKNA